MPPIPDDDHHEEERLDLRYEPLPRTGSLSSNGGNISPMSMTKHGSLEETCSFPMTPGRPRQRSTSDGAPVSVPQQQQHHNQQQNHRRRSVGASPSVNEAERWLTRGKQETRTDTESPLLSSSPSSTEGGSFMQRGGQAPLYHDYKPPKSPTCGLPDRQSILEMEVEIERSPSQIKGSATLASTVTTMSTGVATSASSCLSSYESDGLHDNVEVGTGIQSSYSSPGKSTLKEKLERRLLRQRVNEPSSDRVDQSIRSSLTSPRSESSMDQSPSRTMERLILSQGSDVGRNNGDNNKKTSKKSTFDAPISPISDSSLGGSGRRQGVPRTKSAPRRRSDRIDPSVLRLTRTVRYGRRGLLPKPPVRPVNSVKLHIYDLLSNDTIMQLPWGCEFPIGQCLVAMNNGLRALGTGVYHCGVEINGIEYAYGANEIQGSTGVFTCLPKHSPGYEYRTTIDFGCRSLYKHSWRQVDDSYQQVERFVNGRDVVREMAGEYKGLDYDLLRKNCCTFAKDACLRLGVKPNEIPNWFTNLADTGARTQDAAQKTMEVFTAPTPLLMPQCERREVEKQRQPRSRCQNQASPDSMEHPGYEAIQQEEFVTIVEAVENPKRGHTLTGQKVVGLRRTLSWAY